MRTTSMDSYNLIKVSLSRKRGEIFDVLYQNGPHTAGEIFTLTKIAGIPNVVKGSVCARLTELRQLGVVKEIGIKTCELTGNPALLWEITGHVAHVPSKRAKLEEQLRICHARLRRLEAALLMETT